MASQFHSTPSDDIYGDLDMDLDDALREANTALLADASEIHARSRSPSLSTADDFDPGSQYWPQLNDLPTASSNNNSNTYENLEHVAAELNTMPRMVHQQFGHERRDLVARNNLRNVIQSAILSDSLASPERAALLDDCRISAERSSLGIPFREILSEPMEPLGVPPLMYELMSCTPDWEGVNDVESGNGLEVVLFLIENWSENVLLHGKYGMLYWVVRAACLRRLDEDESNRLFQQLRPAIHDKCRSRENIFVDYNISLSRLDTGTKESENRDLFGFNALISIPQFATSLAHLQQTTTHETGNNLEDSINDGLYRKHLPAGHALMPVGVEFIAAQHIWRLEILSNAIKLELIEGPARSTMTKPSNELYVDARICLVAPYREIAESAACSNRSSFDLAPIELLLPCALLRSMSSSGRGMHSIVLSPCFTPRPFDIETPRRFDDLRFLHDGTLLLELTVKLSTDPFADPCSPSPSSTNCEGKRKQELPSTRTMESVYRPDESEDMYASDDMSSEVVIKMEDLNISDSDGWEEISQMDETEEKDGRWVKADEDGQDEDL